MSRHPKVDHAVMDPATQEFLCRHCGARHRPKLPATIPDFVRESRAFSALHARCQKPQEAQNV